MNLLVRIVVLALLLSMTTLAQERGSGRGSSSRGGVHAGAEANQDAANPARGGRDRPERSKKPKKPKKPRPGIAVRSELLQKHCALCHQTKDEMMGRISYLRKSPEGWARSLKRMIRHHELSISPDDARNIVRYLANDHGLTHGEAKRALYYPERRVHWSEKEQDSDFRKTCGGCHTLGRVLNQQRDSKEWKLLKATHLAFFPLANSQAFRGSRRRGSSSGSSGSSREDWSSLSAADREARMEAMRNGPKGADRADKVLGQLAKDQPLFSSEWKEWEINRREIELEGTWSVSGYEPSRGNLRGSLTVTRTGEGSFSTSWDLLYGDGQRVRREGKGILYAGYSWRGTSEAPKGSDEEKLKEVLLLDHDWQTMRGRLFAGAHAELGMDVSLHRRTGSTRIFDVENRSVHQGASSHGLIIHGDGFPDDIVSGDFHLGKGMTVTSVNWKSALEVELQVDVARDARLGTRGLSFRTTRGPSDAILVYDSIDYIRIMPREGFSRVGGKVRPKQLERFWAVAMCRGVDGKEGTKDDLEVFPVTATWSLEEFHVRPHDDDVKYVGAIDEKTGIFTPAAEGPNKARKWNANNIGDVYVKARCDLRIPVRPKKKPKTNDEEKPTDKEAAKVRGKPESDSKSPEVPEVPEALGPLQFQQKSFQSRGHLLVTVPLYIDWDRYDWDQR